MKRTVLIVIICLCLLLTACSAQSLLEEKANVTAPTAAPETAVPEDTAQIPSETPDPEQMAEPDPSPTPEPSPSPEPTPVPDMNTVFPGLFFDMAAGVGAYDYDECLKRVKNAGYSFQQKSGSIQIPDSNGFSLGLWFAAAGDGRKVLSLVAYAEENDNYEVDVTDNNHTEPIRYFTYDTERDPQSVEVTGLGEIYEFISVEVPRRMEMYREAVRDNVLLDVTLEATADMIDGAVFVTVETNLPDGTLFAITPKKDGRSIATFSAAVRGGKAVSEAITDNGNPLSGEYEVLVVMKLPRFQPLEVKLILGKNGEFLAGPYVTKSLIKNDLTAQRTFVFTF